MIGFGKVITLIALGKNTVPVLPVMEHVIGKTSLDCSQTSWAQNLAPSSVKSSSSFHIRLQDRKCNSCHSLGQTLPGHCWGQDLETLDNDGNQEPKASCQKNLVWGSSQ